MTCARCLPPSPERTALPYWDHIDLVMAHHRAGLRSVICPGCGVIVAPWNLVREPLRPSGYHWVWHSGSRLWSLLDDEDGVLGWLVRDGQEWVAKRYRGPVALRELTRGRIQDCARTLTKAVMRG